MKDDEKGNTGCGVVWCGVVWCGEGGGGGGSFVVRLHTIRNVRVTP